MSLPLKYDHILVVGFGGPRKPEEILLFLSLVTQGKNIPENRLKDVAHHYEVIGGYSPYYDHTLQLTQNLERELKQNKIELPIFIGMRNWHPFLKDTLADIKQQKLKKGIVLILAAHRSEASYSRYLQNVLESQKEAHAGDIEYDVVNAWHDHPGFIQAQADQVRQTMKGIPPDRLNKTEIIFTAHSIPLEIAKHCSYEKEFKLSAEKVAAALQLQSWSFAYQSRTGNPFQPWLEPDIGDYLAKVKQTGKSSILLVPIGFLCDNAEVLFDLDVETKAKADKLGLSFYRASTVMSHPAFVQMWVDLIQTNINSSNPRSLVMEAAAQTRPANSSAGAEPLDIREKGAPKDGQPQVSNRRMYFQLFCFTGVQETKTITDTLKKASLDSILYRDLNDPYGIGIVLMSEDPGKLISEAEKLFHGKSLQIKPELTMLGRSYSSGREQDLEDWLLNKYRRNALNPKYDWAIWYPLRRKPEFALLTREEQGKILMEHAILGQSYGGAELAHDIRLSCYGIDKNDNEFVIGLVGSELYPLSRLIQDMRKTQQTTKYIQSLGPFFVGKVIWQSPYKDA